MRWITLVMTTKRSACRNNERQQLRSLTGLGLAALWRGSSCCMVLSILHGFVGLLL